MKKFDLKRSIEDYTDRLTSDIISPKKRKDVKQEYAEHIEDTVFHGQLSGISEQEAFRIACEKLGDEKSIKKLLGELHNQEVWYRAVIIGTIRKIRGIVSEKRFLKNIAITLLALLILAVVIFANLESFLVSVYTIIALFKSWKFRNQSVMMLLATAMLVSYILLLKVGIPVLSYVAGKIRCYLSIIICGLKNKSKVKITRAPFASLRGMNKKGDIQIISKDSKLVIHFVDVVLKYDRAFTVVNEKHYIISKLSSSKLDAYGMTLVDGRSYYNLYRTVMRGNTVKGERIKSFPQIDDTSIHVVIVAAAPSQRFVVKNNRLEPFGDGDRIGDFVNYSFKSFMRYLKRM